CRGRTRGRRCLAAPARPAVPRSRRRWRSMATAPRKARPTRTASRDRNRDRRRAVLPVPRVAPRSPARRAQGHWSRRARAAAPARTPRRARASRWRTPRAPRDRARSWWIAAGGWLLFDAPHRIEVDGRAVLVFAGGAGCLQRGDERRTVLAGEAEAARASGFLHEGGRDRLKQRAQARRSRRQISRDQDDTRVAHQHHLRGEHLERRDLDAV